MTIFMALFGKKLELLAISIKSKVILCAYMKINSNKSTSILNPCGDNPNFAITLQRSLGHFCTEPEFFLKEALNSASRLFSFT